MPDPTKDFLGSGWKFPPRLNSQGCIELVHQDQDIAEAIKIILFTRKGERPMRPDFGSKLHTLIYESRDDRTIGLARQYITEALTRWEPRIEVIGVSGHFELDDAAPLVIDIKYRVNTTNSERNLTFPFYVIPGEE